MKEAHIFYRVSFKSNDLAVTLIIQGGVSVTQTIKPLDRVGKRFYIIRMNKTTKTITQKETTDNRVVVLSSEVKGMYFTTRNLKIERLKVKMYHKDAEPTLHSVFAWVSVKNKKQYQNETEEPEKAKNIHDIVPAILLNGKLVILFDINEDPNIELFDEKLLETNNRSSNYR